MKIVDENAVYPEQGSAARIIFFAYMLLVQSRFFKNIPIFNTQHDWFVAVKAYSQCENFFGYLNTWAFKKKLISHSWKTTAYRLNRFSSWAIFIDIYSLKCKVYLLLLPMAQWNYHLLTLHPSLSSPQFMLCSVSSMHSRGPSRRFM